MVVGVIVEGQEKEAYTTDNPSTPTAIADEIAGAGGDFAGYDMACFAKNVPTLKTWSSCIGRLL